jgi:hypothetical protein
MGPFPLGSARNAALAASARRQRCHTCSSNIVPENEDDPNDKGDE